MSSLPTEQRPIRMDPDLSREVEKMLEELDDEDQERARAAVMSVYHSGATGSFSSILERYRDAILAAVA